MFGNCTQFDSLKPAYCMTCRYQQMINLGLNPDFVGRRRVPASVRKSVEYRDKVVNLIRGFKVLHFQVINGLETFPQLLLEVTFFQLTLTLFFQLTLILFFS